MGMPFAEFRVCSGFSFSRLEARGPVRVSRRVVCFQGPCKALGFWGLEV